MARLTAHERDVAAGLSPLRQVTWVGGRLALHRALERAGLPACDILSTPRGAPLLPPGAAGSISHKRHLAIAIAAPSDGATLGIDLERGEQRPVDITHRILVEEELHDLQRMPPGDRWRAVMIRFSLKEAVYKALDPFVGRYIAFSEASVRVEPTGAVSVQLSLRGGEGPFALSAWFAEHAGYIVSVVRACRTRS